MQCVIKLKKQEAWQWYVDL